MLPDDCALAMDAGRAVIVDAAGDVARSHDHCGVFGDDHRYLDGLDVTVRDAGVTAETDDEATMRSDADTAISWTVLGQAVDGGTTTTTLTSDAAGAGRGDARAWTLTKRVALTPTGVEVTLTLENNTATSRDARVTVAVAPDCRHVFELPAFFSPRESPAREVTTLASDDESGDGTVDGPVLRCRDLAGETRDLVCRRPADAVADRTDSTVRLTDDLSVSATDPTSVSFGVEFPGPPRTAPSVDRAAVDGPDATIPDRYADLARAAASTLDALMLPCGVPAAGAPRFLAPFGRDSLVVAYQTLPYDPSLAARTLAFLADEQGEVRDPTTLEAPGRIPHEKRRGDLVAIGESIRQPYYGTVDATPLFAALYADVARGTDRSVAEHYGAARAAVRWTLDAVEDGLLTYAPHDHEYGLAHHGWKDSAEALARPDGTQASGPVALAEVQGYVHRALTRFAPLAAARDDPDLAAACRSTAETVAETFEDRFWLPEEGCYALGIDEDGCIDSVASNQAHAFWGGLGRPDRVDAAVDRLLEPDVLTDAGLRTFAASHAAFDPLSYHRGSVWPHDTSVAALGFAERGYDAAAEALANRGLRALARSRTGGRPARFGFPELLSGTETGVTQGHLRHPDTCEPAAWSAGSVFGFVQALQGDWPAVGR